MRRCKCLQAGEWDFGRIESVALLIAAALTWGLVRHLIPPMPAWARVVAVVLLLGASAVARFFAILQDQLGSG